MILVLVAAVGAGFAIGRFVGPSRAEVLASMEEAAAREPELPPAMASPAEAPPSATAPSAADAPRAVPSARAEPDTEPAPTGAAVTGSTEVRPASQRGPTEERPDEPTAGDAEGDDKEGASPAELRESIASVFGDPANLAELRSCYDAVLGERPEAHGRLVLTFVLSADAQGEARSDLTAIESSDGSFALEELDCFADAFMEFEFAAPAAGEQIDVSYPVSLLPGAP